MLPVKLFTKLSAFLITLGGVPAAADSFSDRLVQAAIERTTHEIEYDGSYYAIEYPGGDIPSDRGVCTDVLIRSYHKLGIDLQREVHEDIALNFEAYPSRRIWGLAAPDTNIDHRRVPNLQVFFGRKGTSIPITQSPEDYRPGDLVTWMLPGNLPHIGIVTDHRGPDTATPFVVHNIGAGPKHEDILFKYEITGHFRYEP
ncbi:MAG: DUF1287 domain-containing protein [Gammaproteobacteria bacterium]